MLTIDIGQVAGKAGRLQHGLAAVHGGEVISLDLFASPTLYRRAWRKVARGLLLEGYRPGHDHAGARQLVLRSMAAALSAPVTRKDAPGIGQTLHGELHGMVIGAVVHQGHVYHAFAAAME